MSDFWARKLGTGGPIPRQPVHTTNAWWDAPAPAADPTPDSVPAPYRQASDVPPPAPARAVSAHVHDRCPNCGSGNYFRPPGAHNAQTRCFECGFPNLQSTSGAGFSTQASAKATPARQVSTSNNYNPTIIVNRIQ